MELYLDDTLEMFRGESKKELLAKLFGLIRRIKIARLLHKYNALACFDYAASAPYVRIDMNPDPGQKGGDPSLDAVFISPHKFLGGPGSCGVLVFNDNIYHKDLAPSISAGGTVLYVNPVTQEYFSDIEEREKAGTPGVLQTLKAGMAFDIKDKLTPEKIEQRELELLTPIYEKVNRAIEILGERENYTMIFNAQGLLYAKEELDLTDEVLKILKAGVDISSSSRSSSRPRK